MSTITNEQLFEEIMRLNDRMDQISQSTFLLMELLESVLDLNADDEDEDDIDNPLEFRGVLTGDDSIEEDDSFYQMP